MVGVSYDWRADEPELPGGYPAQGNADQFPMNAGALQLRPWPKLGEALNPARARPRECCPVWPQAGCNSAQQGH